MKKILAVVVFCLSSLLVGCESDNGKYAGTWEANSSSGRWIYRYELTQQDDGYKVLSQEKFNKDGAVFKTTFQLFFKKSGSYLALDNDPHFLEIMNDNELKLVSSDIIFNRISEK